MHNAAKTPDAEHCLELVEALHQACFEGNAVEVTRILDNGGDVNAHEPETGLTALHTAAAHSKIEIVDLLVRRGADVDALTAGDVHASAGTTYPAGWTSMMVSASDARTVARLLFHGADPDRQAPGDGFSVLHMAAAYSYKDTAILLLKSGARRDLSDAQGRRPLQLIMAAIASAESHLTTAPSALSALEIVEDSQEMLRFWDALEAAETAQVVMEQHRLLAPKPL